MHKKIINQETEHSQIVNTIASLIKETEWLVNHLSAIAAVTGENIEHK